jgi:hypothetical protein
VHEAAVSWVEDVNVNNFTFCVMESGRNEGPPHGFATVEYIAYQGAPSGGLAGLVSMPEWWTGTKCQNVDISLVSVVYSPKFARKTCEFLKTISFSLRIKIVLNKYKGSSVALGTSECQVMIGRYEFCFAKIKGMM